VKSAVADYQYRVLCLRIEPTIGDTIRLTQYPRDLTMSNSEVYLTGSGYEFTGYAASSGSAPALIDIEGIAGIAGIDKDKIASGVFDGARAYLFATTWSSPVEDEEAIVASVFGKTTLVDNRYRIEEMSLLDTLNQSVGKTYSAACQKTFGGQEYAGCGIDLGPITVTGTLTAVTSRKLFRDSSRAEAADYFTNGTVAFTTGNNAGLKPLEIRRHNADGTLETFEPFHYAVQVGDSYTLIPGCRKRKDDCIAWSNIENFGGYSFVPVSSVYAQAPKVSAR
jgi:uncharacterized phage protein (TIGR02218 family)